MNWVKKCLLGLVAVGFLYGLWSVIFLFYFPFGTTINDVDVSLMTREDAVIKLNQILGGRSIAIERDDQMEFLTYQQLDAVCPGTQDILTYSTGGFLWCLFLGKHYTLDDGVYFSKTNVSQVVETLQCVLPETNEDGGYVKLKDDGSYEVKPVITGTVVNKSRLTDAICDALRQGSRVIDVDQNNLSQKLLNTSKDISLPDDFTISSVSLDLGAGAVEQVPNEVLSACVYKNSDGWKLRFDILYQYVMTLAKKYDSDGAFVFQKTSGEYFLISSKESDTYFGWKLDVPGTTALLAQKLLSGGGQIIALWNSKGAVHADNPLGDTYIEISIPDQKMWFYQNGSRKLSCDVITGLPEEGRATPEGLFRTLEFCEDYTMYGDYGSSYCQYFIRLTPDGVGIHDASWQSAFGGNLYQTVGSHGCINTPLDAMMRLYDSLSSNIQSVPVVIY